MVLSMVLLPIDGYGGWVVSVVKIRVGNYTTGENE